MFATSDNSATYTHAIMKQTIIVNRYVSYRRDSLGSEGTRSGKKSSASRIGSSPLSTRSSLNFKRIATPFRTETIVNQTFSQLMLFCVPTFVGLLFIIIIYILTLLGFSFHQGHSEIILISSQDLLFVILNLKMSHRVPSRLQKIKDIIVAGAPCCVKSKPQDLTVNTQFYCRATNGALAH